MELMSTVDKAKEWGCSARRIQILCNEGRIDGAVKIGHSWVIPAEAKKPNDERIKTGKYRKIKENNS